MLPSERTLFLVRSVCFCGSIYSFIILELCVQLFSIRKGIQISPNPTRLHGLFFVCALTFHSCVGNIPNNSITLHVTFQNKHNEYEENMGHLPGPVGRGVLPLAIWFFTNLSAPKLVKNQNLTGVPLKLIWQLYT